MCGEQPTSFDNAAQLGGSSPRVRGTADRHSHPQPGTRFIPACAGNSRPAASLLRLLAVHPRVCGEQATQRQRRNSMPGSSPRVRGTVKSSSEFTSQVRFIPACAGNRNRRMTYNPSTAVHPRVCGEQQYPPKSPRAANGSSPRVRGTANDTIDQFLTARFIPACAGNSSRSRIRRTRLTVHPRVCGEQDIRLNPSTSIPGSSPRVRGTDKQSRLYLSDHRFIPACAGNSLLRRSLRSLRSVHPRVCGEQTAGDGYDQSVPGSSPRVRGTDLIPTKRFELTRFIPACAGNSSVARGCGKCRAVHPRVCGEQ